MAGAVVLMDTWDGFFLRLNWRSRAYTPTGVAHFFVSFTRFIFEKMGFGDSAGYLQRGMGSICGVMNSHFAALASLGDACIEMNNSSWVYR